MVFRKMRENEGKFAMTSAEKFLDITPLCSMLKRV